MTSENISLIMNKLRWHGAINYFDRIVSNNGSSTIYFFPKEKTVGRHYCSLDCFENEIVFLHSDRSNNSIFAEEIDISNINHYFDKIINYFKPTG